MICSWESSRILEFRGETFPVDGAFDEVDGPRGRGEPAALRAVGGEHRVDGVRRHHLGEFGARGAIALAGAFNAGGRMVASHRGECRRMAPQHAMQAEVGRDYLE